VEVGIIEAGDHGPFVEVDQFRALTTQAHHLAIASGGNKSPVADGGCLYNRLPLILRRDLTVMENQVGRIVVHSATN
jgi:hypothetical protein